MMLRACLAGGLWLLASMVSASPKAPAIASAHPLATQAGLEVLHKGGNAFDAAVAISAALAVVEPHGSGLGGGGFYLARKAANDYVFIDARERAPLRATPELYLQGKTFSRERAINGPAAAAIPGVPAALAHLGSQYGKLALSDSLAPAIRYARDGFKVDRVYRERASFRLEALQQDDQSARLFLADNQVPELGHVIKQPELANTLELLAQSGHSGFYAGSFAEQLVSAVNRAGGVWSMEDLASYQIVERAPLVVPLNQHTLITAPPPSAGGIALAQSLKLLQTLPWQKAERMTRVHLVSEVLRRVYRDRTLLGDPDFVENPVEQLLSDAHLATLKESISLDRATPSADLGPVPHFTEGDHTTHFTVLDTQGLAVSATLSINLPFGAAFTVPNTGLLLNNEMDDFALDTLGQNHYELVASDANALASGKRPLSSMTPSFMESDTELASFGTPGGSRIPSMVLLAVLEYLEQKPISDWVATPRFHHQFLPDRIEAAPHTFNVREIETLKTLGHEVSVLNRDYGNQQVVYWDKKTGAVQAASDPRGIGQSVP